MSHKREVTAGQKKKWVQRPQSQSEWVLVGVKVVLTVVAVALFIWALNSLVKLEGAPAWFGLIAGILLLAKEVFGVLSQSRETKSCAPLWDQCGTFCSLFGVAFGVPVLLNAVGVAFV